MADITVRDLLNAGWNERKMREYLDSGDRPKRAKAQFDRGELSEALANDAEGRHQSCYFSTAVHERDKSAIPPFSEFIAGARGRS